MKSFPLESTCEEVGISAVSADSLVWSKIAELMCDPKLLEKHIRNWLGRTVVHNTQDGHSSPDALATVGRLKEQLHRYTRAYGVGVLSFEQFSEYALPLKQSINSLEKEIAAIEVPREPEVVKSAPTADQVALFANYSTKMLDHLNFAAKQAIVRNIVEKVVVKGNRLQIHGIIPIGQSSQTNVALRPIDRHSWDTTQHGIPFELHVNMLSPSVGQNEQIRAA